MSGKFNEDTFFSWVVVICISVLMGTCTYKEAVKMINEQEESK